MSIYTDIKVKFIANCHLTFNLYDRKGSEFAPIVIYIYVHFFLYFIQKREAR